MAEKLEVMARNAAELLASLPVKSLFEGGKPYVTLHALNRDAIVDVLAALTATPDRSDDALAEENRRLRKALDELEAAVHNLGYRHIDAACKARAALKGDGL